MNLLHIIVNQACHSGSMMHYLYGTNRILVSAADSEHEAWTEAAWPPFQQPYEHWAFLYQGRDSPLSPHDGFILSMGTINNPESVEYAYEKGDYAAAHNHSEYSYPQIESKDVDPNKIYL